MLAKAFKINLAFLSLVMFSPLAAQADAGDWYVQASGGLNRTSDLKNSRIISTGATSTSINTKMKFDHQYAGGVAFGYKYNDNVRFDIEYTHRSNNTERYYNAATGTVLSTDGFIKSNSFMVNGTYAFDAGIPSVRPYIGAGVGMSHVEVEIIDSFGQSDDSDWAPAGQLTAGIGWNVAENIELFTQYQYFHVFNPNLNPSASISSGSFTFREHTHEDSNVSSSSLLVGVRYSF